MDRLYEQRVNGRGIRLNKRAYNTDFEFSISIFHHSIVQGALQSVTGLPTSSLLGPNGGLSDQIQLLDTHTCGETCRHTRSLATLNAQRTVLITSAFRSSDRAGTVFGQERHFSWKGRIRARFDA